MFNALVLGFVVSLVVGLALGPLVIKKLKEFHARQEEREEGPESHKYKAGTPTMGHSDFIRINRIGISF